MKKIGILGGMTPESTVLYYRHIIETYQDIQNDYAFPEILLYSVSFQPLLDWMKAGNWSAITDCLSVAARALEKAGADFLIISTNTMHKVLPELERSSALPYLSIITATAEAVLKDGISVVGLLGTRFTMSESFYIGGLQEHGIKAIVPPEKLQPELNRIIFEELGKGVVTQKSKTCFLETMDGLIRDGARGIILGCTEIPLLIQQKDAEVRIYDTTLIHARKALAYALESG